MTTRGMEFAKCQNDRYLPDRGHIVSGDNFGSTSVLLFSSWRRSGGTGMKLKALVIDDSRIMRTMVMQSLRKTGLADFEFVEAEDGYDALRKIDPDKTDIVFADGNMPDMSSIEFVEKVRTDRKADRIPIIMVTNGKNTDSIITVLDQAGANAFINKPFTVSELRQELEDLIKSIGGQKDSPVRFWLG